jgi:hypothetical protein
MDFAQIVTTIIEKNGAVGGLVLALFYLIKTLSDKIDKLSIINNRVYGVLITLSDKKDRKLNKEEGEV